MRFDAIIFDFDGVLLESEYAGNLQIADYLTRIGHPTTVEQALEYFMGLNGSDFIVAIERWIGRGVPEDFHTARAEEDARVLAEGLDAVAGAIQFVQSLPPGLPRAVASSSSSAWIKRHLHHMGIRHHFGDNIFSGHEHVARGKPAPDIYLYAAAAIGADIARTVIIEDSPVGVTGAVASGAQVIGLCAGRHCAIGHDVRLKSLGAHHIAHSFEEVAALIA